MGEMRNAYKVLVGKPEGKRLLGEHKCRWEDNIKIDVMEIGRENEDMIHQALDRVRWRAVVYTVLNLWVP
jgi:hypothetical protein